MTKSSSFKIEDHISCSKLYRFAFYARKAAGKTCYLAALAMHHINDAEGYTCSRMPLPDNLKQQVKDNQNDEILTSYIEGKDWLDTAIDNLENNNLPEPNPDRKPLRFLFEFATPAHEIMKVELIDYSGELIDPEQTEEKLSVLLHAHLGTCDGLAILAESPVPGVNNAEINDSLFKLSIAYKRIKHDEEDTADGGATKKPICMIINKWDRHSNLEDTSVEKEEEKLTKFLTDPDYSHASLCQSLKCATAPELFKSFAVSAFGRSKRIDNVEKPISVNPLQSFALEDPFVWLVRKKQELEIQDLREQQAPIKGWYFWELRESFRLRKKWKSLKKAIAKDSKLFDQLKQGLIRSKKLIAWQILCPVVTFVIMFGVIYSAIDSWKIRQTIQSYQAVSATNENILMNENMLIRHMNANLLLKIGSRTIYSRKKIQRIMDKRRKDWESTLYKNMKPNNEDHAYIYLDYFRNGTNAPKANSIIAEAGKLREEKEQLQKIRRINEIVKTWSNNPGECQQSDIEETRQQLNTLELDSVSSNVTKGCEPVYADLAIIEENKASGVYNRNLTNHRNEIDRLIRHGKLAKAAKLFADIAPKLKPEDKIHLEQRFREALPQLDKQIKRHTRDKRWDDSYDLLDGAKVPNVLGLLPKNARSKIDEWREEVATAQDKDLYSQVKKFRDKKRCETYLGSPYTPKSMQKNVKEYLNYLQKLDNEQTWTLKLEGIRWSTQMPSNFKNEETDIDIEVGSVKIISCNDVNANEGTTTSLNEKGEFKAKYADSVEVTVTMVNYRGWLTRKSTRASNKYRMRDLTCGIALPVSWDKHIDTIQIEVSGFPEPNLPPWRNI